MEDLSDMFQNPIAILQTAINSPSSIVDIELLKVQITNHSEFFKSPSKNGWLPIHYASVSGSYEVVKILYSTFPESIRCCQDEGLLPLHLAVYGNEPDLNILKLLLDACPDGALHKSNDGKTPLHICVDNKSNPSITAIKILLTHCPASASLSTNFGRMPLHLATDQDRPSIECITELLAVYPEAAKHQDDFPYRRLPLHYSIMRSTGIRSLQTVELLLEVYPDAVGVGEQHGKSPLHIIVSCHDTTSESESNAISITKLFLKVCPTAIRSRCSLGRTPLMDLVDRDDPKPEILEVLLSISKLFPHSLLLTDRSGHTALHIAVGRENINHKTIKCLLEADPTAASLKSHSDALPIHDALEAASANCAEALLYLIESYPACASTMNGKGWLPLHIAVSRPKPVLSVIQKLIELYPKGVTVPTTQGLYLPLHCAVCRSTVSSDVVRLLIKAYPEASVVKCAFNLTPLGCAMSQSTPSWEVVIPMLQTAQASIGQREDVVFPTESDIKPHRPRPTLTKTISMNSLLSGSNEDALFGDGKGDDSNKGLCSCITH